MNSSKRPSRRNRRSRPNAAAAQVEPLEPRSLMALTPIPAALVFTVGAPPSAPVTVGSFLDSNPTAAAGDFTATIQWGNGTVSAGTVTASPTRSSPSSLRFQVSGAEPYSTPNTYPLTITVDDYEGETTTIDSTADVAGPILTPVGATAYFTAGAPSGGPTPVGYFLDPAASAPASAFTATIGWGDGNVSAGTVTQSTSNPILFIVSGTNVYTAANTYPLSILVQDPTGDSTTIASQAVVNANAAFALSGSLADVVSNGPFAASGFTNTDRPAFSGLAAPFSIVGVFGRHDGADALLPLGETVATPTGAWTFTAGPLAAGAWIFTATATPPGGYPGPMTPLASQESGQGQVVYIDLTPRDLQRLTPHRTAANPRPRQGVPHAPAERHHRHATRRDSTPARSTTARAAVLDVPPAVWVKTTKPRAH